MEEIIKGLKKEYKSIKQINIPNRLEFKFVKCICLFGFGNLDYNLDMMIRNYNKIEYFKKIDNKILEKIDFQDFRPTKMYVIFDIKEKDVDEVIIDLKKGGHYIGLS